MFVRLVRAMPRCLNTSKEACSSKFTNPCADFAAAALIVADASNSHVLQSPDTALRNPQQNMANAIAEVSFYAFTSKQRESEPGVVHGLHVALLKPLKPGGHCEGRLTNAKKMLL